MSDIGSDYLGGLREDHARFSRVLSLIGRDAHRLVDDAESILPLFEEAIDYIVNFQNVHHHPREEIMFARIAKRSPALRAKARKLESEHGAVGAVGKSMQSLLQRAASSETSRESRTRLAHKLEQFANEMRKHIRQEEELLYSHAWDELDESDWEELAGSAPQTDPLSRLESRRYPLLAEYVLEGTQRSDVSMDNSSFLQTLETRLDRELAKMPKLRQAKSIARRHGEEAFAIGRRSVEAMPDKALLRPIGSLKVGVNSTFEFGAAYVRWVKDWHHYVWQSDDPQTDK